MKLHPICILIFLMLTILKGANAQPLCSYTAKISDADKKNSAGVSLITTGINKATLAAIIRQDRANYHQFKVRDSEDEGDCMFSDKTMRSKIEAMTNSSLIDAKLIENIVTKNPVITVTVFQDKLSISAADITNASPEKQAHKNNSNKASKPELSVNSKPLALSFLCRSNVDIEEEVIAIWQYQNSFQLNSALQLLRSTPGCGMGESVLKKEDWELITDIDAFVALRAINPQKLGFKYVYGITTKHTFEN
jgi:hypothetical protein